MSRNATVLGSAFRVVLCGNHTSFTFPLAHAVLFLIPSAKCHIRMWQHYANAKSKIQTARKSH